MANGITIGGLEVQGSFSSNGLRFDFIRGGLQSLATFVGSDDDVPYAEGMDPGNWRASYRDIALHGIVTGTSRENFRSNADALLAKMDPATLVTVVVYPTNFGLSTGEVATLENCRPMSIEGPDASEMWYEGWEITLHLRCIDSPPDWVLGT